MVMDTNKLLFNHSCDQNLYRKAIINRFLGSLLGGAVGDALGAPVEFMMRSEILEEFGQGGIRDYVDAYGRLGAITDDTQMTLFTAEGLLRSWVGNKFNQTSSYSEITAKSYLRWLITQGMQPNNSLESEVIKTGWLLQQRELHSVRAPGRTCLSALESMKTLGEVANNDSKGCGGVMRVAPVGLFTWRLRSRFSPQNTFSLGAELAALTHGHPTGSLSAGVFAVLIYALCDGLALLDALSIAKACLSSQPHHEETLSAIELAEQLSKSNLSHEIAITQLGEGWVAEEALAISIYCALVSNNFEEGVLVGINHDGDSDSTGAITGNILGVIYGVNAIPDKWLSSLELRDVITELANDLFDFLDWDVGEYTNNKEFNKLIWHKYSG